LASVTQSQFLASVGGQRESQDGHHGDEQTGQDEVERVEQRPAANVDRKRDAGVLFVRAAGVHFFVYDGPGIWINGCCKVTFIHKYTDTIHYGPFPVWFTLGNVQFTDIGSKINFQATVGPRSKLLIDKNECEICPVKPAWLLSVYIPDRQTETIERSYYNC